MVAAEKTISNGDVEAAVCGECSGSGTVSHWNEVAYFEDRRPCTRCDAGRVAESRITDIVRRAQIEARLATR